MSWEEYVCPIGYAPLAQIIIAFVLGLILSYFTHSLVIILIFLIAYEVAYAIITLRYDNDRWQFFARIGVVVGYIAGWIVGRALLGFPSSFITRDHDHACDLNFISH